MKVFLDRLGFVFHRPRFHGKIATSIVVQGMFGGSKIGEYLEFVAGGLGFNVVKGSVMRTLEPMSETALQKMDKALADAEPALPRRTAASRPPGRLRSSALMVSGWPARASSNSAPKDKRDHAYYRDQGWLESDYYYPSRLGVIKRGTGAFFDWITTRAKLFDVAQD